MPGAVCGRGCWSWPSSGKGVLAEASFGEPWFGVLTGRFQQLRWRYFMIFHEVRIVVFQEFGFNSQLSEDVTGVDWLFPCS